MKLFLKKYYMSFVVGVVGAFVAAAIEEFSNNSTFSWLWYIFCTLIFIIYLVTPYARKKMNTESNKNSFLFFGHVNSLDLCFYVLSTSPTSARQPLSSLSGFFDKL